jgi:hypothetical protein
MITAAYSEEKKSVSKVKNMYFELWTCNQLFLIINIRLLVF